MKKINLLIVFVLAGLVGFFSSCDNDPVDLLPPTISFTLGEQTVDEGDAVNIAFVVTTTDKLASVRVYIDDVQLGETVTDFTDNQRYSYQEEVVASATETFTFEVVAEDKEGNLTDEEVTVTVTPAFEGTFTEYTVTLGDQDDSPASFIDLSTGDLFTVSTVLDNTGVVDMLHYWGEDGDASLYSVAGAVAVGITQFVLSDLELDTWDSPETMFADGGSADYANITYDELTSGAAGASETGMVNLSSGDLIFFKTEDGLSGLIQVGTVSENKLITDLKYKIQDQLPAK